MNKRPCPTEDTEDTGDTKDTEDTEDTEDTGEMPLRQNSSGKLFKADSCIVYQIIYTTKSIRNKKKMYQNVLDRLTEPNIKYLTKKSLTLLKNALSMNTAPKYLQLASVVVRAIEAVYMGHTLSEIFWLLKNEFLQPGDSFFEKQLLTASKIMVIPSEEFRVKVMAHFLITSLYGAGLHYVIMLLENNILPDIDSDPLLKTNIKK
jgi:hypothetical protein